MLSAPFLLLEFDHPDAKIDIISNTCVALTAGDALAADSVLAAGAGSPAQLSNPFVSDFAEHVRQRFVEARRRLANEHILEPRGMSFQDFYVGGLINRLPTDLALVLDSQVQQLELGVTVLLAGVDQTGAHIYSIADPGTSACYDRVSYHAVGSGHRHALLTLVGYNQHRTTSLNQTVFNVYCSKRAAESAPGVGTATEIRVITKDGIKSLSSEELGVLSPLYERRVRPKLEDVEQAIAELPYDGKGQPDGKE
jgi:hypothetical protein